MARVSLLMTAILTTMFLALPGCGGQGDVPEMGTVHGTVTMNGRPFPGVLVVFQPDDGRPQSIAKVNDDGGYTAYFYPKQEEAEGAPEGIEGVAVGPCTVRVNQIMGNPTHGGIPDKYGVRSELKLDVIPGDNTFDIAMQSR